MGYTSFLLIFPIVRTNKKDHNLKLDALMGSNFILPNRVKFLNIVKWRIFFMVM